MTKSCNIFKSRNTERGNCDSENWSTGPKRWKYQIFFVAATSTEGSFKPKQDKLARSVRATVLRAAALHMIDVLALS